MTTMPGLIYHPATCDSCGRHSSTEAVQGWTGMASGPWFSLILCPTCFNGLLTCVLESEGFAYVSNESAILVQEIDE